MVEVETGKGQEQSDPDTQIRIFRLSLDQPEASPLVLNRVVRDVFPQKGLDALAISLADFQKADRKLAS
jgi:hypothetical protein